MKVARLAQVMVMCLSAAAAQAQVNSSTTGWKLVWSDEFNGPADAPPNPANWNFDLGGGGWGNGEAETYTNSLANAFQDGQGHLVIRAIRDASGNYTSARIRTGSQGEPTDTADLSWKYFQHPPNDRRAASAPKLQFAPR